MTRPMCVIAAAALGVRVCRDRSRGRPSHRLPTTGGAVEARSSRGLVAANRTSPTELLDAYGHVRMRHPRNPDRYLLSRSLRRSWLRRPISRIRLNSSLLIRRDV